MQYIKLILQISYYQVKDIRSVDTGRDKTSSKVWERVEFKVEGTACDRGRQRSSHPFCPRFFQVFWSPIGQCESSKIFLNLSAHSDKRFFGRRYISRFYFENSICSTTEKIKRDGTCGHPRDPTRRIEILPFITLQLCRIPCQRITCAEIPRDMKLCVWMDHFMFMSIAFTIPNFFIKCSKDWISTVKISGSCGGFISS